MQGLFVLERPYEFDASDDFLTPWDYGSGFTFADNCYFHLYRYQSACTCIDCILYPTKHGIALHVLFVFLT